MIVGMPNVGRRVRRLIVVLVEKADEGLDAILYRPFVVKAFEWLPRWWRCDLSRLSMWLDDRWGTGYWGGFGPSGLCEACRRRGSDRYVGGWALESEEERGFPLDDDDEDHYLAHRPVSLCGWCRLPDLPIEDDETLQAALAWARERSVTWRWSPGPYVDSGRSA